MKHLLLLTLGWCLILWWFFVIVWLLAREIGWLDTAKIISLIVVGVPLVCLTIGLGISVLLKAVEIKKRKL